MTQEKESLLDELAFYKSQLERICHQTGTQIPVYTRKAPAYLSNTQTQSNNQKEWTVASEEPSTPVRQALHLQFFSGNANDVTHGDGDDEQYIFVS